MAKLPALVGSVHGQHAQAQGGGPQLGQPGSPGPPVRRALAHALGSHPRPAGWWRSTPTALCPGLLWAATTCAHSSTSRWACRAYNARMLDLQLGADQSRVAPPTTTTTPTIKPSHPSAQARRYFGKATALDRGFAPAWVAFGHAFAAQDESDQVCVWGGGGEGGVGG